MSPDFWIRAGLPYAMFRDLCLFFLILCTPFQALSASQSSDPMAFDDQPLQEPLELPSWFKLSFLDLKDNLNEARQNGKKGLIVYFGRKDCPYCEAQLEVNWGEKDIVDYTRQHFDVVAIDVQGLRTVTDFDGKTYTEKQYAALKKTNFTPTLFFYTDSDRPALKLPGYRPPYQFRAVLEFIADGHYKREHLSHYLARAENALSYGQDNMNANDNFMSPPYNLDRSHRPGKTPLLVFFEHPRCHACDVLHGEPMEDKGVNQLLSQMEVVQLNIHTDTPVITPDGRKITSRQWADELKLTFAPSLVFFDEKGEEILRVESVIRLYRLKSVLRYILSRGYKKYPTFQIWRTRHMQP